MLDLRARCPVPVCELKRSLRKDRRPMNAADRELLDLFELRELPVSQWNHRTHVSIAFLYLRQNGFQEALCHMRRGVKAFNAHNGIEDSPISGYNETTTVAFLRIIDAVDQAYQSVFPTGSSEEFCDTHPQLMNKHVLRFFYSPDRRMHPDAKTSFLEPDLAPLPNALACEHGVDPDA
jgi:hypothetical protein